MRRVMAVTIAAMLSVTLGLRADAKRWWSHVEALANDGMEGRNTGSPAHKRAAEYVAAQFKKAGLEPAGVGGYIQPVAFKTRRIVEAKSSLALVTNGKTEPLTLGEDANISMRVDPAPSVDAPLVFVGYGLNIPERNINDFAGVNLKGAVVVYISATPTVAARSAAGAFRLGRPSAGRCTRRPARSARSASPTRRAWTSRGRARRWRGCSRRCRSPTRRSTKRRGSSCRSR